VDGVARRGDGALRTLARVDADEVAVFDPAQDALVVVAEGRTRFVIGSAAPHPYGLALGNYSVHQRRRPPAGRDRDPSDRP
jgi:hypothetical protein